MIKELLLLLTTGWVVSRFGIPTLATLTRLMTRKSSSLIHVKGLCWELHYYHNNQKYIIPLTIHPKPNKFAEIVNFEGDDISTKILPYMGPNFNFHLVEYKPRDFGEKEITFTDWDFNQYKFQKDEIITLK
jgi:hypothetical protein